MRDDGPLTSPRSNAFYAHARLHSPRRGDARLATRAQARLAPRGQARLVARAHTRLAPRGQARLVARRRSALVTPRQLAMLLALAALWGASFLFMRVAVPSLGPVVLADARVAIAGVALLGYAVAIGARPALRVRWRDYLLLGAINAALPFSLLSAAELEIEASLAAVLNAMAPLCGALVG
ncbi:MAG TPA: DMT family transporter, partial [Solirubrobacteraceae bacterium]|nr:DMT family transporter [Solirubrobacteraceae bacterium]